MVGFSDVFKARAVQRLVGPKAVSANRLSDDLGVAQETLSRWLREARNVNGMTKPARPVGRPSRTPKWSGAEKLRIVLAAHGLSETALGAFLRREGLHEPQLREWRAAAEVALNPPPRRTAPSESAEARRITALERELRRKDAALAETAALLVLKKKSRRLDDIMPSRTAR